MTETSVPNDQKRRLVADFNALAETYDTIRAVRVCAHRLVALAAPPPGAQVLDVATGTGWAALAAAQHVGPTGRVLGVDLAPELLEHARQKAATAGLTHVEFRTGDATRLDLADQCVDVVLCASALFFLPDMLAALREWHRVLTPGGQVAFSGFGPTFLQPLQALWEARLRQYGVSVPTSSPGQRLAEPETCRQLLHEAGFGQPEVQSEQLGYYYRTVEEYWEESWASVRRMAVLQLPPAQREQFKVEHLAEVGALATAQGIWRDVAVHFARGWKRTP
jgi:ubiquinone/menaquinone biosynthesis C-methylase UbiE